MEYAGRVSDHIETHEHGHAHGSLEAAQTRTVAGLVAVLAGVALVLNGVIVDWFVDPELGIGSLSALIGAALLTIPIVRNAICTALHAFHNYERDKEAQKFVDFQFRMIPHYMAKNGH